MFTGHTSLFYFSRSECLVEVLVHQAAAVPQLDQLLHQQQEPHQNQHQHQHVHHHQLQHLHQHHQQWHQHNKVVELCQVLPLLLCKVWRLVQVVQLPIVPLVRSLVQWVVEILPLKLKPQLPQQFRLLKAQLIKELALLISVLLIIA
jgi:hypothetical protein